METVETGTKNRCVIEVTHVLSRSLGKIKFRAFLKRVSPLIGISEHYRVVGKK